MDFLKLESVVTIFDYISMMRTEYISITSRIVYIPVFLSLMYLRFSRRHARALYLSYAGCSKLKDIMTDRDGIVNSRKVCCVKTVSQLCSPICLVHVSKQIGEAFKNPFEKFFVSLFQYLEYKR